MSQAITGNYYIVNSVANSADGSRLAINFNGQSQPLTVSPLVTSNVAQIWTFSGSKPSSQSVSPKSASGLQIAFGSDNTLTALPASSYVWDVTADGTGNYTFQDGGMTIYWDIYPAQVGQNVTANSKSGYPEENWWLYNA